MSWPKRKQHATDRSLQEQALIEDRQNLLSVLLELRVSASELFNPNISILNFLERIAERLGCFAVLCIEASLDEKIEVRLVESIGLSYKTHKLPIFYIESEWSGDLNRLISNPPFKLNYPELNYVELRHWTYAIPIGGNPNRPESIYYFQLYFSSEKVPKEQYFSLVERLLSILKDALSHRKLYQKTIRALQIRDDFISIASHELRTPLTSLRLQYQLMLSQLEKKGDLLKTVDPTQVWFKKILTMCDQELSRLSHLVFGLLDVSKIQAGKLNLEFSEVNLSDLVLETINRLSDQFKTSGYKTQLDIKPNIVGYWDPLRLEQVINNLIVNAMKFGAGKPIEISLKCIREQVELSVRDQGIGISKDQHEQIFRKYERVSSTNVTGLGLGLYIVRQIVEHHQGSIQVKSTPGKGSTFIVRLPLKATQQVKVSA